MLVQDAETNKIDAKYKPDIEFFGFDASHQSKRATDLINILGSEGEKIAHRERQQNEISYLNEFILDHALSQPREYYSYKGEFYSYPLENPSVFQNRDLVKINKGFDPREREGRAYEGFRTFEELASAPKNENKVTLLYSPAGKAGKEPPWDKIVFESGRLYVSFNKENQKSTHFDIKIQEAEFPITNLMNVLSDGQEPPQHDPFYFLTHPLLIHSPEEFFSRMNAFKEVNGDMSFYTSQRNNPDKKRNNPMSDILHSMEQSLVRYSPQQYKYNESNDKTINELQSEDSVRRAFISLIEDHMTEDGVDLYGCSTTHVGVSKADLLGRGMDTISEYLGIDKSAFDGYSSASRTLHEFVRQSKEKNWFIYPGPCRYKDSEGCKAEKVGPCQMCKNCEKKYPNGKTN